MDIGAKVFIAAICLAVTGGVALLSEIAGGRTGNPIEFFLAIPLLIAAGIANLLANYIGIAFFVKVKMLRWWWPFSMVGTLGMLYGCWVPINL